MGRSSPRNAENEFSRCRLEIKSVFRIDRMGEEKATGEKRSGLVHVYQRNQQINTAGRLAVGAVLGIIDRKGREHQSQVRLDAGESETYLRAKPDELLSDSNELRVFGKRAKERAPRSYLGRRDWRGRSSASRRCWWPHTRTCPGPTLRSALSGELLVGNSKGGNRGAPVK